MASQRSRSFSLGNTKDYEDDDEDPATMFDVVHRRGRERIVLQRLIVIARLPHDLDDRTEPAAHYEKLNFQLSRRYVLDPVTGLLLVYPSCLLHVMESSRDVLLSVLKDMQQTDGGFMEAPKVVFVAHAPQSRLFQQWSYKVLGGDQLAGDPKGGEEEEESTETLVCTVLQALGGRPEAAQKDAPGSLLDETPGPAVSQAVLNKLLTRGELLTPQQHLQMYNSPVDLCTNAGRVARSSCLTTI